MIVSVIFSKIKKLILFLITMVKKSLCCFRRRRKSGAEFVPLATVGVIPNYQTVETKEECMIKWEEWGSSSGGTVQDRIEEYRRQQVAPDEPPPPPPDYFKDMVPEIRRQARMYIKTKSGNDEAKSRLSFKPDTLVPSALGELESWEENSAEKAAWAEAEGWSAEAILKQKRREERQARRPQISVRNS